jgi:hypothetical protein
LVRHQDAGTLKPDKAVDLNRKSNLVIAALIRADLPEHEVRISWRGLGRVAAGKAETARIITLVHQGCVLANDAKNPRRATVVQVLKFLGVESET